MKAPKVSVAKCVVPVLTRAELYNLSNDPDVDVIEIYLDNMGAIDSEFLSILTNSKKLQIATSRVPKFAQTVYSQAEQIERFSKLYDYVDYFDFDVIQEALLIDNFIQKFSTHKLICSYHNYTVAPSKSVIDSIVDTMCKLTPKICKLAWICQLDEDLTEMINLALSFKSKNIKFALSPMGNLGVAGRMVLSVCGMEFVYCTNGTTVTANGQITIDQCKNFISSLGLSR
jgi:3-dehydroquinate dehydratase type I